MFNKDPRKALFFAIITVLMWSTVATGFKLALTSFTANELQAIGLSIASITLLCYMAINGTLKEFKSMQKADYSNLLLQGLSLCFYNYILFEAYSRMPVQIVQPINNCWALAYVFMSAFVAKQSLKKGEVVGLVAAAIGVFIIALGGAGSELLSSQINTLGLIYAIGCAFFFALYLIINAKSKLSALHSLVGGFICAAMFSWLWLFIESGGNIELYPFENTALYAVIYLAFFEWAFPFLTWALAVKYTNSISTISIISFFVPFLSLFWASLVLSEPIIFTTLIGLVFIVGGTIIQQKYKNL